MKTSNYLKVSLGLLTTFTIVIGVLEILAKRDLKTCESRQSFGCPRFTCPQNDEKCGSRPWIYTNTSSQNDANKTCIGYCSKDEKNCLD